MKRTKKYLIETLQRAYDSLYYEDRERFNKGLVSKEYIIWEYIGGYDVNEHCPMLKTKRQLRYVLRKNPEIYAVVEFDCRGRRRDIRIINTGYDRSIDWGLRKIDRHW